MTKDKHAQSWSFREDFSPAPHSKFGKFDPRPAAQTTDEFPYNHLIKQSLEPNPSITDEQFVRRLFSPLLSAHPPLRREMHPWILVRGTSIRFLFKHCFQTIRSTPLISTNFGLIFCPYWPVLITIFITGKWINHELWSNTHLMNLPTGSVFSRQSLKHYGSKL